MAALASAFAATPCDELRNNALQLEAQHPEATVDTGDGRFLKALLGAQPEASSQGVDCEDVRAWLKDQKLNSTIADDLENGSDGGILCFHTGLRLFDERKDGGFVALSGTSGSGHFPVGVVLDAVNGQLRIGWSWDLSAAEYFDIVRVSGHAYPAVFGSKISGTDLSYSIDLLPVDPASDAPLCSLSILYEPEFLADRWFGRKGEGDVDPEVRRIVAPIVSALAAGRDATQLVKPWLDHARDDTPYDDAIAGYPDTPVAWTRYTNTGEQDDALPRYVPFLAGGDLDQSGHSPYESIGGAAPIPLYIHGRRLLLLFGYGTMDNPPPEAGFGVFEYNGQSQNFDGVAGGIMMRRGRIPRIE
jgi:hypothetical protein